MGLLLAQLAVIALASLAVARAARPLRQPAVVGEMLAGLLLGPSLLGRLWPAGFAALFPASSVPLLASASKAGIVFYMFGVGLETRAELDLKRLRAAAGLSLAGLLGPFVLGCAIAGPLGAPRLFLGAAMSITAFPVLARILEERGLSGSPLGALVLSAGALDDLVAWAIVSALVWRFKAEATVFMSVAFAAGLLLPGAARAERLRARLAPLSSAVLLPAYFAFSGLRTRLDLLSSPALWGSFVVILVAASLGKGVACALAARAAGHTAREAFEVGALMNTRGLMELVILNIGLEHGLITPTLYAMMALMALVTTFAGAPLCEWAGDRRWS